MNDAEKLSEAETERRREDALKRMLSTPHKPHAETKVSPKEKPKTNGGDK